MTPGGDGPCISMHLHLTSTIAHGILEATTYARASDALTPDGGWLINHRPEIQGQSVATGGSGHGFKFLPVIGQHICEALDITNAGSETASFVPPKSPVQKREMRQKWRWGREENLNVKDRRVVLQGRPILDVTQHLQSDAPKSIYRWIRPRL